MSHSRVSLRYIPLSKQGQSANLQRQPLARVARAAVDVPAALVEISLAKRALIPIPQHALRTLARIPAVENSAENPPSPLSFFIWLYWLFIGAAEIVNSSSYLPRA